MNLPVPLQVVKLQELDILDVGNAIRLVGAIWAGNRKTFLAPFPEAVIESGVPVILDMDGADWERFLHQTDVQDVRGPGKAILRKSQRQIDNWLAWKVFYRDGYHCRYCGRSAPLTVDHVILWEEGGATVEENLVSACSRCNKLRGNKEYAEWLMSIDYVKVSGGLTAEQHDRNKAVVEKLEALRQIQTKPRSR